MALAENPLQAANCVIARERPQLRMPLTCLASAKYADLQTAVMYFKTCAVFGSERTIHKQGGIVLEADGHVFNVPWYGVEPKSGQSDHK